MINNEHSPRLVRPRENVCDLCEHGNCLHKPLLSMRKASFYKDQWQKEKKDIDMFRGGDFFNASLDIFHYNFIHRQQMHYKR